MVEYLPKLQKRKLNGHRKPVLCLAHSSERLAYHNSVPSTTTSVNKHHEQSPSAEYNTIHHPSLLLSGSEDGTARLWDLRTRKTSLCMVLPQSTDSDDGDNNSNEVVSVAFHPSINNVETRQQQDNCKEEVTSQPQPSSIIPNDCTVYATTSNRIYGYDLRYHSITYSTSPIILLVLMRLINCHSLFLIDNNNNMGRRKRVVIMTVVVGGITCLRRMIVVKFI